MLYSLDCIILKNELLSKHCSFKIGGTVDFFIEIKSENTLLEFLKIASVYNDIKYYILGKGTNVLFSDDGYNGIVICLVGNFKKICVAENKILCGCGVLTSELLNVAVENSLSGIEYLAGIPGTVGGAVYGNAGSANEWIGDSVNSIEIYKNLKKKLINKEEIAFEYRKSGLNNCIITKIIFSLKKTEKNDILSKIVKNIQKRLKTQPLNFSSIGSIFKNPNGFSVGKLIERAGLKGLCIGHAQISELHGNFIINKGDATAKNVVQLIDFIKLKIKKKFNIDLEIEIKIVKQ
jgi:UDP-N-acetylmuramate dehydrogenase